MNEFDSVFIGNGSTKRAQNIFLCTANKDKAVFDSLKNDLSSVDGICCYFIRPCNSVVISRDELEEKLKNTDLVIVYVTDCLMEEWSVQGELPALQLAIILHINILPIARNVTALEAFSTRFFMSYNRNIHIILQSDAAYQGKLGESIQKFLAPLMREIVLEKAFQAQVFLSYRKMDLDIARKFMR
jgi:hypothetical protein